MPQTLRTIADKGAFAENWFIHTPVCCPSRAEFLSGRYFHNIRVGNNTLGGCMHVQTFGPLPNSSNPHNLPDLVNPHSFAKYLVRDRGYTAAWFGKHLNSCPRFPPPGFDCPTCRWFTCNGGSDTEPGGYLGSTFNDFTGNKSTEVNGSNTREAKDGAGHYWPWLEGGPTTVIDGQLYKVPEHGGYWTAIIGNKSIEYLHAVAGKDAKREADGSLSTPFVLTVAPKAPHYAATPAPWYENTTWVDLERVQAPRTASFAVDPKLLSGHHSMIANQSALLDHEQSAVDGQFRKRWVSLLSVDDAIAGVAATLEELNLWESTYFFVTSDVSAAAPFASSLKEAQRKRLHSMDTTWGSTICHPANTRCTTMRCGFP